MITKEAIDPQYCMSNCWAENDRCQSFNYFPSLDICELNEASNLTNREDLIDRPDSVYVTNPVYGRMPVCSTGFRMIDKNIFQEVMRPGELSWPTIKITIESCYFPISTT